LSRTAVRRRLVLGTSAPYPEDACTGSTTKPLKRGADVDAALGAMSAQWPAPAMAKIRTMTRSGAANEAVVVKDRTGNPAREGEVTVAR
jgi:hypothetical protein